MQLDRQHNFLCASAKWPHWMSYIPQGVELWITFSAQAEQQNKLPGQQSFLFLRSWLKLTHTPSGWRPLALLCHRLADSLLKCWVMQLPGVLASLLVRQGRSYIQQQARLDSPCLEEREQGKLQGWQGSLKTQIWQTYTALSVLVSPHLCLNFADEQSCRLGLLFGCCR